MLTTRTLPNIWNHSAWRTGKILLFPHPPNCGREPCCCASQEPSCSLKVFAFRNLCFSRKQTRFSCSGCQTELSTLPDAGPEQIDFLKKVLTLTSIVSLLEQLPAAADPFVHFITFGWDKSLYWGTALVFWPKIAVNWSREGDGRRRSLNLSLLLCGEKK